ncbi:MAG: sortase [Candidatus Blackburnbacteria bacterium]|nr:sortase [Candidatus Blackburnbacteria bacterium]
MKKRILKAVSLVFISIGVLLTLNAGLPIIKYELFSAPKLSRGEFISPISKEQGQLSSQTSGDLVRASNWFVGAPELPDVPSKVKYYTVSILKLKIEDVTAEIGGDDLSKSLVHYKGTALPGKKGNAVVFGHSTLPQLFDSKNYLTIFSYLPSLAKGDKIFVNYDGIKYTYQVYEMFEVKPQNIEILEQTFDDAYLTLVTCVPPGTYLRRLVVKSRLVPLGKG